MYIQYTYICLYNIRKTCCFLTSTYLISTFLYSLSETSCQVVAGFFSFFSCTSRGDFLPHLRTQHLPRHSISRYHQENITDKTYKTIFRANPLCLTGNILNMYSCFPPHQKSENPNKNHHNISCQFLVAGGRAGGRGGGSGGGRGGGRGVGGRRVGGRGVAGRGARREGGAELGLAARKGWSALTLGCTKPYNMDPYRFYFLISHFQ